MWGHERATHGEMKKLCDWQTHGDMIGLPMGHERTKWGDMIEQVVVT